MRLNWQSPKSLFTCLILLFSALSAVGQGWNMTLHANYDDNTLPFNGTVTYNEVWGYESGGKEYAILGVVKGTQFIDVSTPSAPSVCDYEYGADTNSTWRDYKTYQNFCFAVGDVGNSSLQVFDLSYLPDSVLKVYDSDTIFSKAHNVFVDDDSARLYVAGADSQMSGLMVLDISTPSAPTLISSNNLGKYVHDVFVRHDTVYCFMGAGNGFEIWDFSNPLSPSNLASYSSYPFAGTGYSHQGWLTEDDNYMIHNDETHDHPIKITDVSNYGSINTPVTLKSNLLAPTWTNSIAHNCFVKANTLYISYYWDGVQLYDITDPLTPRKRAYWDTDTTNATYFGIAGCWGVYPFLPSGNILASDVNTGLFILSESGTFPVELEDFVAETQLEKVYLSWITWSESSTEKFAIERSSDGKTFEELGDVLAAGNSNERQEYTYIDPSPATGKNYYRLRIVDLDGEFEFSPTVIVDMQEDFTPNLIYPNPAKKGSDIRVDISFNAENPVTVRMFDMLGKAVHSDSYIPTIGMNSLTIGTNNLEPGTYILDIAGSKTKFKKRIVVY